MDLRKLKKLIDLVEESGIAELEITEGEEKVRIAKHAAVAAPAAYVVPQGMPGLPAAAPVRRTPRSLDDDALDDDGLDPEETETETDEASTVTAPMVGIFWRGPTPAGAPCVDTGSPVKVGDLLCIIEAMKQSNEIRAERAGIVREILVDNGEAVQFGDPLFVIG